MNWRAMGAIVGKDLMVVGRSKGVLIPLIIVPVILTVAMPAVLTFLPRLASTGDMSGISGMDDLLASLPVAVQAELAAYTPSQRMIVLPVVYYLAPFFLILPLMVSTVIAADSVAGEKERKTLEALLYTPTNDRELFFAKVLAAWLPALAVSWGGFLLYTITVNWTAWPVMGKIFFPTTMWYVLVIWVAPAVAGLGLSFTVLVSSRVDSFQEAYQIGGVVITPVVALIVAQAAGALYFSTGVTFLVGLVLWGIDAVLLWYGSKTFHRQQMALKI